MLCFPLDNVEYEAKALGAWLGTRTRGVFSADSNLAVWAAGGMTISVTPGLSWLKMADLWGAVFVQEEAASLTIDGADASLPRIDIVCIQLRKSMNEASIVVKKGTAAVNPLIVSPVRDSDYDELYLASVYVAAGATEITSANITDLRLNETYCGVMRDGVTGIPTAQLQAQAEALIDQLQAAIDGVIDGSQYMLHIAYDNTNEVSEAGGIVPYVASAIENGASNFNVITSATPPDTAPEDTIWVPQAFSDYAYGEILPDAPADGELHIPKGVAAQVKGKALKDMLFGIGMPKLWSESTQTWDAQDGSMVMKNGVWQDLIPSGYIYDSGTAYKDIQRWVENSYNGSITFGPDSIVFNYNVYDFGQVAASVLGEDVTEYNTLYIDVLCTQLGASGWSRFGLATNAQGVDLTGAQFVVSAAIPVQGRTVLSLDISAYSGAEYYIKIWGILKAQVFKWWME